MKTRGLWMLLAALAAGIMAVILAVRWMQTQGGERGRIAVAAVDIGLGTRVGREMLRLADWPRDSVPSGSFQDLALLEGRVVTGALQRGEALTEARLAPVGARAGLSAVVPEGKRAMTVRVNDVVGVAGFALPGTWVDVLVNTQEEGGRRGDGDRSISKIVLERILVLAVAQESDRDATRPKVVNAVTLELTPQQAEQLDLARSVGTLSLVLRNPSDPATAATAGATKLQLLGAERGRDAAPSPPAARAAMQTATRVSLRAAPAAAKPAAAAPSPSLPISTAPVVARTLDAPVPDPRPERACVELVVGATRRNECF